MKKSRTNGRHRKGSGRSLVSGRGGDRSGAGTPSDRHSSGASGSAGGHPSAGSYSGRPTVDTRRSEGHRSNASQPRQLTDAPLPLALYDVVEVEVIGLAHEGEGVGRYEGFTLFIPGALPGERVRARVVELKKKFGRAELLKVLTESPERVAPPCSIYDRCGGCQLQHLDYNAQLRWKRQIVVDALTRIGKLNVAEQAGTTSVDFTDTNDRFDRDPGVVVHPVLGMDDPWRYRNKAQVPIGFDLEEGGLVGGFYERGTHRIVGMETCLIQHELNDDAVVKVKAVARELGIEAYDSKSHTGWLRHVVVKVSFATSELMVVLVGTKRDTAGLDRFVERIREEMSETASIVLNVNRDRTSPVFGDETVTLWGADVIYDEIGGIRFAISARSFYQVNPLQTERLYQTAFDYAGLTGVETVIDAYCGIGTISLFLARAARQVYGIEIVPDAVEDARANARLNGIDNADFTVGRAEAVIPALRAQGIDADVIVVDPPRKGCDAALLDTIAAMQPRRIVYVSCNPATLARDLRILEDRGYRTVRVQPVDMFPHTGHVEMVCLLIFKGFG